ncbi:MAG: HsdM family class I SAM-dependent methyltransferase [Blastocatellia bacterium]
MIDVENIEDLFSLASATENDSTTNIITVEDISTAIAATLEFAQATTAHKPTCKLLAPNKPVASYPRNWTDVKGSSVPEKVEVTVPLYHIYAGILSGKYCRPAPEQRNTVITLNYDTLSGVIDVVDFAAERNGERDVNPAKLRGVVETFSDPRYRLGLADVQPDFLGRAYEYLLRKFAEGSGQSAGEFFTPTEVGFLIAHLMRPRPGDTCHDYACGSAGLLIKLQLVARELDPTSKVPLKLSGQELQAESYAVAQMNAIIHDMEVELARGDTMINPKFRTPDGRVRTHDIVVANPMWNQPFAPDVFANDPFDRFRATGGVTSGKGDWAWLQHTVAAMNEHGRAAVVLDTGAVTRGSGSKNEDRERNIRKWFVDRDLVDGVILLPENLFYNTNAAGVIVVLSKRKPAARQGKIVLFNASRRVKKGRPKNYIPEEDIRPLAAMYLKGKPVEGEIVVITREQAEVADYNLSPSRWVGQASETTNGELPHLLRQLSQLSQEERENDAKLMSLLRPLMGGEADVSIS